MALVRWTPFSEIDRLQRQMNRLFEDSWMTSLRGEDDFMSAPAVEISETDEAVLVKLEIPGMEAKDLNVEVTKNSVVIQGERKQEQKSEENGVTRSEFRYGKFERVIPLAVAIDNQNVSAEYKDGILKLNLPKAEEEKQKVVKVNLG
jgi:HSP20 family protein